MKKIIYGAIVLIVVIGAYFLFIKNGFEESNEITKNIPQYSVREKSEEEKLLVGEWQSIDDSFFSRNFNEDQTFRDSYKNEGVTSSGTWFVFDSSDKPEYFQYPVEDGNKYLVMNDTSLSLNFIIAEVGKDSLSLIYLDNGGVLNFKNKNE